MSVDYSTKKTYLRMNIHILYTLLLLLLLLASSHNKSETLTQRYLEITTEDCSLETRLICAPMTLSPWQCNSFVYIVCLSISYATVKYLQFALF